MPRYEEVVKQDEAGEFVLANTEETPCRAVAREFMERQGGPQGYARKLSDDFDRARGIDPETGKRKGDPSTQAVQIYHNIARAWQQDAMKEKALDRESLPYSSEEERAQLIEMLLEEVVDSREMRRKFVNLVVKRDPELMDELCERRRVVIDVSE